MPVPQHESTTAGLRGNPAACLLCVLLLWSGHGGGQAQRAGGAAPAVSTSVRVWA
uniref:Collagen type XXII alpha 1 chain n=1 Tax=Rousettus aegyptiacus TaxID=9407 RepID=A0A7J8C170_ROUAE|nr:collagen type XXII alpha 1 chain [Rousettus aegyptiacus]